MDSLWLSAQHLSEADRLRCSAVCMRRQLSASSGLARAKLAFPCFPSPRRAPLPPLAVQGDGARHCVSHLSRAPKTEPQDAQPLQPATAQHRARAGRSAAAARTGHAVTAAGSTHSTPQAPGALVAQLGELGYRCKGTPRWAWPSGTATTAATLAASLLPHVRTLSPQDAAHCCWALAQVFAADACGSGSSSRTSNSTGASCSSHGSGSKGGSGNRRAGAEQQQDAAEVARQFATAVQRELLSPSPSSSPSIASPSQPPPLSPGPGPGPSQELQPSLAAAASPAAAAGPAAADAGCGGGGSGGGVAPHRLTRLAGMSPKDLSKLIWALAKMGVGARGSSGSGSDGGAHGAGSGRSSVGTGSSTAAASAWEQLQDRWWAVAGRVAADAIEELTMPPQALCNVLWSFDTLGRRHLPLLRAAALCIVGGHRTRFEPVGLSNLLGAFSGLGFHRGGSSSGGSSSGSSGAAKVDNAATADADADAAAAAAGSRPARDDEPDDGGPLYDALYGALARMMGDSLASEHTGLQLQHLANAARALVAAGQHRLAPVAGVAAAVAAAGRAPAGLAPEAGGGGGGGGGGAGNVECVREVRRLIGAACVRGTEMLRAEVAAAAAAAAEAAIDAHSASAAAAAAPAVATVADAEAGDASAANVSEQGSGAAAAARGGAETGGAAAVSGQAAAALRPPHDPHATSVLCWAVACVAQPGNARCGQLLEAAVAAAAAAPGGPFAGYCYQDLCMLLRAHVRVRRYSPALVAAVRERLTRGAADMQPQALTDLVYCLAVSNYYNQEMYDAVCAAVLAPTAELPTASAAGAAAASATAGASASAPAHYAAAALGLPALPTPTPTRLRLHAFGPRLASRLLWSLARARHHHGGLLTAASEYMRTQLGACGGEDLLAAASAAAQLHAYHHPLWRELGREVTARLRSRVGTGTGSGSGSVVAPSAAALDFPSAVPAAAQSLATKAGSAGAAAALAAAASLGSGPRPQPTQPQLPPPPAQHQQQPTQGPQHPQPLSPRALVGLLWSGALLSHVDEGLLAAAAEALARLRLERMAVPAVMQLFQTHVMLQDLYDGAIEPPQLLTRPQLEYARLTWRRVTASATSPSRLQGEVVAALRRLGCAPSCERITLDGLFSIDTSVVWGGRRVAVEVDGPSHFTLSKPFRPLGRTLAKRRCLEVRGWRVLSVPGHEWRALGGDAAAEEAYLRAALDGALWRTHVLPSMGTGVGLSSMELGQVGVGGGGSGLARVC